MLHGDVLGKNKKSTSRFKPRVGKSNGRCTRYVTYKSLAVKRFFANVTPLLLDSWDVPEQEVFRRTKRQDVGRLACIVWLVLEPVGSSGGHAERLTVESHVVRSRAGERSVPHLRRSGRADQVVFASLVN